jgi:hypothetical protein
MDIAFLKQDFPLQKLDKVSVFCSNKTFLVGHRKRLNFVKELKTRLGSRLDWYGNGINPIAKKYDGLAPYKYSIVLENQRNDYVLTEKLYDPFLTLTYPFYWGAGNSSDFFEQRGYGVIDIDDPDYSSTMILAAINEGLWDKSLPFIKENKARTLKELNFLRRMLIICENSKPMVGQNILIKPLKYYETSSVRIRKHVKRKVRAMVNSFNTITPYGEKL